MVPKSETKNILDLEEKLAGKIMEVANKVGNAIKNEYDYDGIMIMSVTGEFQDVPHFHLHVFGRNSRNDIKIIYPEQTKNKDLKAVIEKLKNAL